MPNDAPRRFRLHGGPKGPPYVLLVALTAVFGTAQTAMSTGQGAGSGSITGVVVDGATKAPLAGAIVYLANDGRTSVGQQSRQITDEKGRFAFLDTPASDRLTVTASAFGYLDGAFGRENILIGSNGGIAVRAGEWVPNVRIVLWRPSAINGTVVDERGEPVAGVFVRLLSRIRIAGREQLVTGPLTTTDDRGMYRIGSLGPGRYIVQVPSVQASAPSAPMTPIQVGRTTGAPGGGPVTQVVMPAPASTAPAVVSATEAALEFDATRLVLRNYPTPPPPIDGRPFAYPPTFHPSATSVGSATAIELGLGEERSGVDVTLNAVAAWRISGTVDGPAEALANLTLRLIPEGLESLGNGGETATALVAPDGRFVFLNVPGGSYIIDAPITVNELSQSFAPSASGASIAFNASTLPTPPSRQGGWSATSSSVDAGPAGTSFTVRNFRSNAPSYVGRTSIAVGSRDEDGVVVRMRPAGTMTGRIVLESSRGNATPRTGSPNIALRLDAADANPGLGRPSVGGIQSDFTLTGLLPGRYLLRGGSTGWLVKSISWQGRDFTDTPFDAAATQDFSGVLVTLTDDVPILTGVVRDAQGAVATSAIVIAFSTDRNLWTNFGTAPTRLKQATAGRSGSYRVNSMPAGDYYVVAVDAAQAAHWFEPEFLEAAERAAVRTTLRWAETTTMDLSVATIR